MTFQGYFQIIKFSSVMMHLNWSLPSVHTMKLVKCKYANIYIFCHMEIYIYSFFRRYIGILLEYQGTRNSQIQLSNKCIEEMFLLKMKAHFL